MYRLGVCDSPFPRAVNVRLIVTGVADVTARVECTVHVTCYQS